MGAIADSFVTYVQPLLDQTDGSTDQVNQAFAFGQLCWNLALLPEDEREAASEAMRLTLQMDDDEFADFRDAIVTPMIRRYEEMFPHAGQLGSSGSMESSVMKARPSIPSRTIKKYPGTGRNEACPCNSGQKYKRCCGR